MVNNTDQGYDIKTTVRLSPTPTSMTIIKKNTKDIECWQGCEEIGTLYIHSWCRFVNIKKIVKNHYRICHILQKIYTTIEMIQHATAGIYPKELKSGS